MDAFYRVCDIIALVPSAGTHVFIGGSSVTLETLLDKWYPAPEKPRFMADYLQPFPPPKNHAAWVPADYSPPPPKNQTAYLPMDYSQARRSCPSTPRPHRQNRPRKQHRPPHPAIFTGSSAGTSQQCITQSHTPSTELARQVAAHKTQCTACQPVPVNRGVD